MPKIAALVHKLNVNQNLVWNLKKITLRCMHMLYTLIAKCEARLTSNKVKIKKFDGALLHQNKIR